MPVAKSPPEPQTEHSLRETEAEEVRLEDIEVDADGIVTKPEVLAGLSLKQVIFPRKRALWVRLRKEGLVPAEN